MKGTLAAGGICILVMALAGLSSPVVLKSRKASNRTEAISNAKQLHLALIEFDSEYGSFPDTSTIPDVQKATGTSLRLGSASSNEIFRQIIAAGNKSEKVFWAASTITPRKPDDAIHGRQALKKGECAFAYVAGLSSSLDPDTPVLLVPVDPVAKRFERRKDYGDKAVVVFLDGSARQYPINRHGKVELNGMDLFDPRQPFWKGKAPDIKWPE